MTNTNFRAFETSAAIGNAAESRIACNDRNGLGFVNMKPIPDIEYNERSHP